MSIKKILLIGKSTPIDDLCKVIKKYHENTSFHTKNSFQAIDSSDDYDLIFLDQEIDSSDLNILTLDCPIVYFSDNFKQTDFFENNTIIYCHCTIGLSVENAIFALYSPNDLNEEFMNDLDELLAEAGSAIWADDEIQFDGIIQCVSTYLSCQLNLAKTISETLESYGFTREESDDITIVSHMCLDSILEQSELPIASIQTQLENNAHSKISANFQSFLKDEVVKHINHSSEH